ncbi:MAG: GGDEF domain-containing protein [Deltaproteobacteria bacterium]|jgi:diguanylate cyclase (GGDEF)-like protein|nr:GGDEF domain-containing protein [Deltaproteobacteria bacterium]
MSTQRKTSPVSADPLIKKLAGELASVAKLLASEITGERPGGLAEIRSGEGKAGGGGAVLIGRLAQGLDPIAWNDLVRQCGLDSWLAIPLDNKAGSNLQNLADALDRLVYQRDHDPLTGLANRRCFDSCLSKELERAKRNHTDLSLVVLDLDNFKRINDSFGHPCGDYALKKFGAFLKHGHRSFELVARIGGDEFAIVLPGSNPRVTKNMLERVCQEFCRQKLKFENLPEFMVSFSAGVAAAGPSIGYPGEAELLNQADQSLYEAKRKGKNQVCISAATALHGHSECLVLSDEKKFLFNYAG